MTVCMLALIVRTAQSDDIIIYFQEKPVIVRTPQSDDKGMKRKLLSPGSPTHNNNDDDGKKDKTVINSVSALCG